MCSIIKNNPYGIIAVLSTSFGDSSETDRLDCSDPDAAHLEVVYDCDSALAVPIPCSLANDGPLVVEVPEDVSIVAEAVYCTGGEFEVEWRGHFLVDQHIVSPEGTV